MTKQALLYDNAVPLSSSKHRDWSVKVGADYGFARELNAAPVTAVEFLAAASEYPIVFAGNDQNLMPLALLGTAQVRNVFVGEDGSWNAAYVPAFVRRYPFIFATTDASGSRFTLCIDEGFAGCNTEGRGERLFDSEGNRTQYLNGVMSFLQEYEAHFRRTRAFCAKLKELDLLEPVLSRVGADGTTTDALGGIMGVGRQKLREIDAKSLGEMFRSNELEFVYLHMFSLRNFRTMLERAGKRAAVEPAAGTPSMVEGDAAARAEKEAGKSESSDSSGNGQSAPAS